MKFVKQEPDKSTSLSFALEDMSGPPPHSDRLQLGLWRGYWQCQISNLESWFDTMTGRQVASHTFQNFLIGCLFNRIQSHISVQHSAPGSPNLNQAVKPGGADQIWITVLLLSALLRANMNIEMVSGFGSGSVMSVDMVHSSTSSENEV